MTKVNGTVNDEVRDSEVVDGGGASDLKLAEDLELNDEELALIFALGLC